MMTSFSIAQLREAVPLNNLYTHTHTHTHRRASISFLKLSEINMKTEAEEEMEEGKYPSIFLFIGALETELGIADSNNSYCFK